MKLFIAVGLVLVAFMATSGVAEEIVELASTYSYFPYCPCSNVTSYHLDPVVKEQGAGTYCFKVVVEMPAGCDSYCCTEADLRKLEIDVNPECKVSGQPLSATINGKESAYKPTIEKSVDKESNTYILKVTGMGLTMATANGAEVCITLGKDKNGKACTTLEELCKPPEGSPAGVCSTALFDSKVDCCGMSTVPKGCETCVYVTVTDPGQQSYRFTPEKCAAVSAEISSSITAEADKQGAIITSPFGQKGCTGSQIKICGAFASDQDGAKLQPWLDANVNLWISNDVCAEELQGATVRVDVAGDGADYTSAPPSCLAATGNPTQCFNPPPDFPKCKCEKGAGVSVFNVGPAASKPGRKSGYTLHCFSISADAEVSEPVPVACKGFTSIYKVELYADSSYRSKVSSIALKTADASSYKYVPTSWSGPAENTLKATALKWSVAKADGAEVCVELANSVSIDDLCVGNGCTVSLFDASRKCCPTFTF